MRREQGDTVRGFGERGVGALEPQGEEWRQQRGAEVEAVDPGQLPGQLVDGERRAGDRRGRGQAGGDEQGARNARRQRPRGASMMRFPKVATAGPGGPAVAGGLSRC